MHDACGLWHSQMLAMPATSKSLVHRNLQLLGGSLLALSGANVAEGLGARLYHGLRAWPQCNFSHSSD